MAASIDENDEIEMCGKVNSERERGREEKRDELNNGTLIRTTKTDCI